MSNSPLFFFVRKLPPVALIFLGAFAAVAACLQALHYPFVIDDATYISMNPRLDGLHWTELWRLFVEPYNDYLEFLPLRDFSYWFDMSLFGLTPAAFRLHNILLYLLCLPLVYGCTLGVWRYFRATDAASAPWAASVVTTLFALHPSHAEAVVWIAGRKDVLSGMFSLLALWLALNARREHGLSASYAAATLVALMAAMLSKATAVAVAPLIAMLWVLCWRDMAEPKKSRFLLLWPFAALVLAVCVALIFSSITKAKLPFYFGMEAITRTLAVLGWLARLAVSPESRHFFYPVFEDPYLAVMVALGVATLSAAVVGAVVLLRKRSLEGFALTAFLLICLPSIQLIPYAPPSLVSDRFVFLAVWPAILLLVSLSWHLKPVHRTALLLVIALSWSLQTAARPRDWRSHGELIGADMRAFPGYYVPAAYMITTQLQKGLSRDAGETASAISDPVARSILIRMVNADYLVRAKAVDGGNPRIAVDVLKDLGRALKNPPDKARWNSPMHQFWESCRAMYMTQWDYLIKHYPDDEVLLYNAGMSGLDVNRYKGTISYLGAAIESSRLPANVRGVTFYSYGLALMKDGDVAKAEAPLRTALEQNPPDLRAHCALSDVYRQTGRAVDAMRADGDCRAHAGNS